MGTTAIGIPYPESTDPVMAGADAMKAIAQAVDAKMGMVLLADQRLSANATNIDFPGISQIYADLELIVIARGDAVANAVDLGVQLNGVNAASSYDWERLQATGTAPAAFEGLADTMMRVGNGTAANAAANAWGVNRITIADYATLTRAVTLTSTFGRRHASASGGILTGTGTGYMRAVQATGVTRVTLVPSSGNFVAGTRATLYGIRGSLPPS